MYGSVGSFADSFRTWWFCIIAILFACGLTIILPIAIGGLHASGDLGVYLGFSEEFRSSIASGNFYPSWGSDSLGFGNVGVRFYPPVAPYLSALIAAITGEWYNTVWIYFCFWMIVGCWGVNLFVKEFGSQTEGTLARSFFQSCHFAWRKYTSSRYMLSSPRER